MAATKGKAFEMGPAVKEFSFFNRWFVFRRKREETMATAAVAEAEAAVASMNRAAGDAVAAARGGPGAGAAPSAAPAPAANLGREAVQRNAAAAVSAKAAAIQRGEAPAEGEEEPGAASARPGAGAPADAELGGLAAKAASLVPGEGVARTVPVAPGPAAVPGRTYGASEVFLFYTDAATAKDSLKIGDKGAGRWLAPSAPFRIEDPDDKSKIYPTVEHFLGAMRVKLASNKSSDPAAASTLAASIFSREGRIHQKFLQERLVETEAGTKALSEERDHYYTQQEQAAVKDAMRPPSLKKYGVVVDEAMWAAQKDAVLEEALKQRWTRDARFRKIVEAARNQGRYLLYYTPGASTSNVGGVRRASDGRIMGDNKMGKIIMKLAGFPE